MPVLVVFCIEYDRKRIAQVSAGNYRRNILVFE